MCDGGNGELLDEGLSVFANGRLTPPCPVPAVGCAEARALTGNGVLQPEQFLGSVPLRIVVQKHDLHCNLHDMGGNKRQRVVIPHNGLEGTNVEVVQSPKECPAQREDTEVDIDLDRNKGAREQRANCLLWLEWPFGLVAR